MIPYGKLRPITINGLRAKIEKLDTAYFDALDDLRHMYWTQVILKFDFSKIYSADEFLQLVTAQLHMLESNLMVWYGDIHLLDTMLTDLFDEVENYDMVALYEMCLEFYDNKDEI